MLYTLAANPIVGIPDTDIMKTELSCSSTVSKFGGVTYMRRSLMNMSYNVLALFPDTLCTLWTTKIFHRSYKVPATKKIGDPQINTYLNL